MQQYLRVIKIELILCDVQYNKHLKINSFLFVFALGMISLNDISIPCHVHEAPPLDLRSI